MSVSNHPSQPSHSRYKARADADFDWGREKLVRLEISVGQQYHEGAKLEAALKWADNHFEEKVILLGDTLQRYNFMMDGMSAGAARKKAHEAGNLWIDRNADLIGGLKILRWNEVLAHKDFLSLRWKVGRLYRANHTIRSMVNSAICEIADRRRIDDENRILFFDLSLQYLLEEAAGTAIEHSIFQGVSAYPGSIPRFWTALSTAPNYLSHQGLENSNCIRIRFKKK